MFTATAVVLLLAVLWLPSFAVVVFGRRRPSARVVGKIWLLWAAQPAVTAALIYLADAAGLANPVGYMLAICMAMGGGGAFVAGSAMRRDRAP